MFVLWDFVEALWEQGCLVGFVFFGVVSRKCFLSVYIFGVSVFSAGNGFVEGDGGAAVWSGCIGRLSFAVG